MGILANTDSSILKVDLENSFKIHGISEREGIALISIFERLPLIEIHKKFFDSLSEGKLYYIDNSFEGDIEMNSEGSITSSLNEVGNFHSNFVYGYLHPVIRLMRLFKEGNICMPFEYYYIIDNNIPKSFMWMGTSLYALSERFTLEDSEIPDLQRFIQNIKLPLKESFLQLAFENFELSYQVHHINLSFLSLMISLETLFNPSDRELRYRVSRNTAVLLGKDKEDSKMIFSEIKALYDKRSTLVHTGELNIINKDDLLKLRYYVRESIKKINNIGKGKGELLDLLNSCGFGELECLR